MQLTDGGSIDVAGTIGGRQVIEYGEGQAMAKAALLPDGSDAVLKVVWWEPGRAPPDGARVRIKGRVKAFNGSLEIHAEETRVERTGGEGGLLASIAAFYLACVEAEAASTLRLRPGGKGHIVLSQAASPLHETLLIPEQSPHHRWFAARSAAVGETLLSGWPLVTGTDPDTRKGGFVSSPLLVSEVELGTSGDAWQLQNLGAGADLNPFALDLIGIKKEARDELAAAVAASVEVEESMTSAARSHAILHALRDEGVDGLDELDPEALEPAPDAEGIHNAGVVMTTSASARTMHNLVEDLEEIANYPELVAEGPASVLLGQTPAPNVPLPEPHPSIALSSLRQDQAVHSAMANDFTVVTGPPGTGKSQVLVNVVAAAVARGETVLLASKNNRAVDVVVDRLRSASPGSIVVRTGSAGRRNEVADYIANALSSSPPGSDPAGARQAWTAARKSLSQLYGSLHKRQRLRAELNDREARVKEILDRLPPGTCTQMDLPRLETALTEARKALDSFGDPLWLLGRWQRHRTRLDDARKALLRVGDFLGTSRADLEACLASIPDRPKRSLAPRKAFQPVEHIARDLQDFAACKREIQEFRTRLAALPPKHELEDRLNELREERLDAGARLLAARWAELRHENPEARTAALQLAEFIERMSSRAKGARKQVFQAIPKALPALPVWAVTNLSARTNLPLKAGLFDLVVIDEASQCDIASALPLLVRGKRALIVGDQKQLIHIASLSRGRERTIAGRFGLSDSQIGEFSYAGRSCFALASSRVSATPIFLDLHFRSHPAIASFSNERFYGAKLELCSAAIPPEGLRPVEWIRVAGSSQAGPDGRSRVNAAEADRIVQAIVRGLPTYNGLGCDVGIVTPYGAQARLIEARLANALGKADLESLKVATAHRFQGDERDIMYFSPVIDRSMSERNIRFASDPNLVNVALTRARRRLIVVGDPDACLAHDNALRALANYAIRLGASGFDSPLELALHEALLKEGVAASTGVVVGQHRLDLAVERDNVRLGIECDGAAFHTDHDKDTSRDRAVESEGWAVIRFSGRELSRDLDACVNRIIERLASG